MPSPVTWCWWLNGTGCDFLTPALVMYGVRSSCIRIHNSPPTARTTRTREARAMALLLRGKICIESVVFKKLRNRLSARPAAHSYEFTCVLLRRTSLKQVSITVDWRNGIGRSVFLCATPNGILGFHFAQLKSLENLRALNSFPEN